MAINSIFNKESSANDLRLLLNKAETRLGADGNSVRQNACLDFYVRNLKKQIDPENNKSLTERIFNPLSVISDKSIFDGLSKIIPGSKPLWDSVIDFSQRLSDTLTGTKHIEAFSDNMLKKAEGLIGINHDNYL